MAHTMHLDDDGILQVRFIGDFGIQDVKAYVRDFYVHLDAVPETAKLHIILDASAVGKVSGEARRALVGVLNNPDPRIGNSAMVGSSRYLRVLGSFLLKATGRDDVRFFETRAESLAWLKEELQA